MMDEGLEFTAREGSEREVLLAFLNEHRRRLRETVRQVSDDEARRRLVPSSTTPMGLLKHAAFVETVWFTCRFGGVSRRDSGIPETVEESFVLTEDDTLAALARRQEQAAAKADEIITGLGLNDTCHHPAMGTLSLRWVLTHCIRELATHTGHAEILVEQIQASRV